MTEVELHALQEQVRTTIRGIQYKSFDENIYNKPHRCTSFGMVTPGARLEEIRLAIGHSYPTRDAVIGHEIRKTTEQLKEVQTIAVLLLNETARLLERMYTAADESRLAVLSIRDYHTKFEGSEMTSFIRVVNRLRSTREAVLIQPTDSDVFDGAVIVKLDLQSTARFELQSACELLTKLAVELMTRELERVVGAVDKSVETLAVFIGDGCLAYLLERESRLEPAAELVINKAQRVCSTHNRAFKERFSQTPERDVRSRMQICYDMLDVIGHDTLRRLREVTAECVSWYKSDGYAIIPKKLSNIRDRIDELEGTPENQRGVDSVTLGRKREIVESLWKTYDAIGYNDLDINKVRKMAVILRTINIEFP